MAISTAVKYRTEFVRSFAQMVTLLSDRGTDEMMSNGLSAVFDIADMGGDLAERGVEGTLPRLTSSDAAVTVTLREYGGKFQVTDFDAFTSQSNERQKMYEKIMGRVNRRLDRVLITELDNASTQYNGGSAVVMTPAIATDIITELEEAQIPISPQDVTFLGTPKVRHQLMKSAAYTSSDYVSARPYASDEATFTDARKIKNWLDVGWIFSPLLGGVGTASAKCYLFHRRAIGIAKPSSQIMLTSGFSDEDHYHFCSGTVKAAAKILQSGGIIEIIHDDTAA